MSENRTAPETPDTGRLPSADLPPSEMRRVALASFIGSVIEFYDFGIYGVASALVFAQVFFPSLGTAAGTIAAFATLGVAFVARPVGAVVFGHIGDRLGRKTTLIVTLLTMGVATVIVGLMPTTDVIGPLAPSLLVVLRFAQGFAAGGEWAGAALFAAESAPSAKRGIWSMFPSLGGACSLALASGTFWLTSALMSPEAFIAYGWRIPFLASIVLVLVGLWIRLKTQETSVFLNEIERGRTTGVPFIAAFRSQPREVLLASGAGVTAFALNFLAAAYLTNYGTAVLKLPSGLVLGVGVIGGLCSLVAITVSAVLSDRIGRRRVLIIATAASLVWSLALFPLLDTRSMLAFGVGVGVTFFLAGCAFGPMASMLSELFATRYRYTAVGLAYNIAGILGGAIPPLIATPVIAAAGTFAFGLVLAGYCVVSLICILLLRETRGIDLAQLDDVHGRRAAKEALSPGTRPPTG
jgi:MFS family permease